MPTWIVQSERSSIATEGAEWLDALAAALPHFSLPPGALGRLRCSVQADGSVVVFEPDTAFRLHIAALDPTETLFDRCAEISDARDIAGAAAAALRIAGELVPTDAGAVLVTTRDGARLQFVAAFGPKAGEVLETAIPVDTGIAGFITHFETAAIVRDVRRDCRFDGSIDRDTGYQTRSMLAVPVHNAHGPCFGCLELINPPRRFGPQDLQVAQAVGSALAAWFLRADV